MPTESRPATRRLLGHALFGLRRKRDQIRVRPARRDQHQLPQVLDQHLDQLVLADAGREHRLD